MSSTSIITESYKAGASVSLSSKRAVDFGESSSLQATINAATINSAYAMGLSGTHGSISRGKIANFFITKPIPSYEYMPYAYTQKLVDRVFLNGKRI